MGLSNGFSNGKLEATSEAQPLSQPNNLYLIDTDRSVGFSPANQTKLS